jgi:hypothetical protein
MEEKNTKVGGKIELESANITECAGDQLGTKNVCSRDKELRLMTAFAKEKNIPLAKTPEALIKNIMDYLKVEKESEIYENSEFTWYTGSAASDAAEKLFKPKGPANSTDLLNNYNIDNTMKQWAGEGKIKNKKFYAVPFQMIDFANQRSELNNLDIPDLMHKGYDSFGVVFNTDVSSGRGKHWFCVYGNLKPNGVGQPGTEKNPITIEYFNSSGNPAKEEVVVWMEKLIADLLHDNKIYAVRVNAVQGNQIQKSKTECGMWSLIYIWSRLMDKPTDWLIKNNATDEEVIEARKRFFR